MNSRERVLRALNHQEPDRVPFDLGATVVTGIHLNAYANLREHLQLACKEPVIDHLYQQLARVDDDLLDRFQVDVRSIFAHIHQEPREQIRTTEDGRYYQYYDGFGVGWQMPVSGGFYFDMFDHPLSGEVTVDDIAAHPLPDPADPERFQGLRESALKILEQEERALTVGNMSSGIFELLMYLRGYLDGYLTWGEDQPTTQQLLHRFVDLQLAYWETMFDTLEGIPIDVVEMSDDMAGQSGMLISPDSYRKILKPLHQEIFDYIHSRTEAKIFFHSCGNLRPVIPDLIEIGIDILNPVQVNAEEMDSAELKQEFGSELVFWGGGVDTQGAFDDRFTPEDVRRDVRRRLEDLMPGGGFIFTAVHNIQGNVPPENILAMWETLQEFGRY